MSDEDYRRGRADERKMVIRYLIREHHAMTTAATRIRVQALIDGIRKEEHDVSKAEEGDG